MATDEAVIAARGWVFLGEVDAPAPESLEGFNPNTPAVENFQWISSTSKENIVNLAKEGGETTVLDTWDTPALRSVKSDEKWTVNFNSVAITKDTLTHAFPGGTWNKAQSRYEVGAKTSTETKSVLVVIKDEVNGYVGLYFPRGQLSLGDVPTLNAEGFMEVPLTLQALTSTTAGIVMAWILPKQLQNETEASTEEEDEEEPSEG